MKNLYILLFALVGMTGANAQWFPQNSGTSNNLNSVYFSDASVGYAVGDTGIILKTNNGGENWELQFSGTSNDLFSVQFTDSNTGYAVGDSGTILQTIDGGENWENQFIGLTDKLLSVHFTDNFVGYAVGGITILKTNNSGINWSVIKTDSSCNFKSVHFTSTNTGYVAGSKKMGWDYGAIILKTVNGGSDWVGCYAYSASTFYCAINTVYFASTETGFACGYAGGYFGWPISIKTNNGGNDWFDGGIKANSINFSSPDVGYAVGSGVGEIAKTLDGGTNWIIQYYDTDKVLNSVYFPSTDTGYIVGDSGIILKTTNGGGDPVGVNPRVNKSGELIIFPNPSSDKITISLPVLPGKTLLSIYNVSGEKVMERQLQETETQIDISDLPQGVYFVRLKNEKTVEVGKFLKQ